MSCGKKAREIEKQTKEKSLSTEAEKKFHALRELRRSVNENDFKALEKVIKENPQLDLNQHCDDGETLLSISIKKNFLKIRDLLISKGADPEKTTINKETPLISAVLFERSESVIFLLSLKVDLNKKNANGDTALHLAIKNKNEEIATLLIKHGADTKIPDKNNKDAARLALDYGIPDVFKLLESFTYLEEGTPDIATFRSLVSEGSIDQLKNVLSEHPSLPSDYEVINPLVVALENNDETKSRRTVSLLLNYQANPNGPLDSDTTPLIKAIQQKKKSIIGLLMKLNVKVDLVDHKGKSPLIWAIHHNDLPTIKELIERNAPTKYTITTPQGKRYSQDACSLARRLGRNLPKGSEEKEINRLIQESLSCSILNWIF